MTALKQRLVRQIALTGPMSVADYFAACLFDPAHGYYTTRQPFGRSGDFVTAPDVTQMFGELLAVWAFQSWQAMGRPTHFAFAEIGPGRGTMMVDMARALARIESGVFLKYAEIFMIEASTRLGSVQRKTLAGSPAKPQWVASVSALPDLPLIIIGNELFDAVPIRQYIKTATGWRERLVGIDAAQKELAFVIGIGAPDQASLPGDAATAPEGAIVEIAPARTALMEEIATRIVTLGGAGLFIDYGFGISKCENTLQAIKGHEFDPVLANPGMADLTSHVDFSALSNLARSCGLFTRYTRQGDFLLKLGLLERAGALGAGRDAQTQNAIHDAVERLAGPDQMGELFKVLAIGHPEKLWFPP